MSRLTDEQIDALAAELFVGLDEPKRLMNPWNEEVGRPFARAIERALDDQTERSGKGVQPPDGTTALKWFLQFDGPAIRDPIERLRFFCSFAMNGQDWQDVEPLFEAVCAEPSMSTTSPPDGSLSSDPGASGECVQAPDGETER